jgi:cell shape-determining protein MreC
MDTSPKQLTGTSEQRLWQIVKFHETRINQLFGYITKVKDTDISNESLNTKVEELESKIALLEKDNSELRAKMGNSVSLNISE